MDIFSHGLWSSVLAQATNLKVKSEQKLNPWIAAGWGIFPDIFAFTPLASWVLWERLHGRTLERFSPRMAVPPTGTYHDLSALAHSLYNVSHSAVVFVVVVALIVVCNYLFFTRRFGWHLIPWEMSFWLLHIITDIPTHTHEFYPTPVLWPLSNVTFNGIGWATPWFLVPDYTLLILFYVGVLYLKRRRRHL